ncbi:UNVERIFIED_CONTAM: hypothetical protein Sradi_5355200 [Sesamum radiatum]|uniref:Uncharacterized protein n=1 Tax=Sesamum radiatum TaxID=300843 RepID=A0AAW2LRL5_SESRA
MRPLKVSSKRSSKKVRGGTGFGFCFFRVHKYKDWCHPALCAGKRLCNRLHQRVDEYVWQEVTLLKATYTRDQSKVAAERWPFCSGEELCRTCISIRTVMLGHNHAQTLAAQETLAKLVKDEEQDIRPVVSQNHQSGHGSSILFTRCNIHAAITNIKIRTSNCLKLSVFRYSTLQ